jgi:class 3 adenylate cyclase/tetratricopeptide (TPR) repeat protein
LPPGAKFCFECARPVGAPGSGPRFTSPEIYTPRHLAERILNSKTALEGERKQVTVLFADLKGSMELLADRDAEEARKLLDPVLELMMEAVHRYEGTVNQVMGDGIMALFGAPLAHEDHAVRACYAALRMQESIARYADHIRRTQGVIVRVRIGLNSGDVVVRSIGSDLRMDYSAVGYSTHLAARMEQMADPGTILLAPSTLRLAEGYVAVKPLGPTPVRGIEQAVEVYELRGATGTRSRLRATSARGLTRFVGRNVEIELLRRSLDEAAAGRGQLVAVVGEPGVGKSRLFYEFTHSHRIQGWLVLETGSVSYGRAAPYLPVIDLLKAYTGIDSRDDGRRMREKLIGKILTLDRTLEAELPALLALLDLPIDDPVWTGLDPGQRRQRTLGAVKRLILTEARVQPMLLVVEDLHWVDAETQALLDALVESLPGAPILLLVNYRPEYVHAWGGKSFYAQVRLDALGGPGVDELFEAVVGPDPSCHPLKALLLARTAGNPFFMEETAQSLVETGVLRGEPGAYRLTQPIHALEIPAAVQPVLAARIDRLAPEDKRLLQAAAVIGTDVPFALLLAVAEREEADLRGGLARLQAAEFLYETRIYPDLQHTFKHALTHEVAYASVLQERRRAMHARLVQAIETTYAERLVEHMEHLARHAFLGEDWPKAVAYLEQWGRAVLARAANREAANCFGKALAALARLPDTAERQAHRVDLLLDLRQAEFAFGDLRKNLEDLREAERAALALGDRRRLGWVHVHTAQQHYIMGRNDVSLALARSAMSIADELSDPRLQTASRYQLGATLHDVGAYREAEEIFRRNIEELPGERARDRCDMQSFPAVHARAMLASALAQRGDFTSAIRVGQDAVALAETLHHPFTEARATWELSKLHVLRGDTVEGLRWLNRTEEVTRAWQQTIWESYLAWCRGHLYALSGQAEAGLALLQKALDEHEARQRGNWKALMAVHLGEACLLAGRRQEARAAADRGLALAREGAERGHEAYALRLSAAIAADGEPTDGAAVERRYHDALTLATELGMRPLMAHCHAGLGTLYRRLGNPSLARDHLARAAHMYREMDMRLWLEQAAPEVE